MTEPGDQDHLFISYAWEDAALAHWLALKLMSEGYAVWIDHLKLTGGEPYPSDIDTAIKTRTFRMLAVMSENSVHKPNPQKERTLALNIGRERGVELLIPLNATGMRPTELDWMTNDLTFIPFASWSAGLKQLLGKLASIDAPRTLSDGTSIAASAYLPGPVVSDAPEVVLSNVYPFTSIPDAVYLYRLAGQLCDEDRSLLKRSWPSYTLDDRLSLAFHPPRDDMGVRVTRQHSYYWPSFPLLEGWPTRDVITALLRRSLDMACRDAGLLWDDTAKLFYFPDGLVTSNRLSFVDQQNRRTHRLVAGERKFRGQPYRYFQGLAFLVRQDLREDWVAVLRTGVRLSASDGEPLSKRALVARRKHLCRNWWNAELLARQLAAYSFVAGDQECVRLGPPGATVELQSTPLALEVPISIDEEHALRAQPAEPVSDDEDDADEPE